MVSGLFLSRQSTARHAVVANGVPPIRVEPFAWSYKHASTFLEVVAQQRAVILNVLNYTLLFACDERMTARY